VNLAWIAGLLLAAGMPLQVKLPQACDHAAPPEGMQWVCTSTNPCDCHLEPNAGQDQPDDGTSKPSPDHSVDSCLACRIAFFVIPAYPEDARQGQKQGIVSATLVLTPDGTVEDVRIQSGDPQLATAVQLAFRQWIFTPGKRSESIPISVKFVLADNPRGLVTGRSLLNTIVTASPAR